jgi:hypothetical protein
MTIRDAGEVQDIPLRENEAVVNVLCRAKTIAPQLSWWAAAKL